MLVHECKIGMTVEFGRGNGEWTTAEIVKINPKKAVVKTLETRGRGRGGFVGAEWSVPYSMMRPVMRPATPSKDSPPWQIIERGRPAWWTEAADEPYPYNPFSEDNGILQAIVCLYNRLSPENLSCDGEKPRNQIILDKTRLERKLNLLFQALGRPVSEGIAYEWSSQSLKKST